MTRKLDPEEEFENHETMDRVGPIGATSWDGQKKDIRKRALEIVMPDEFFSSEAARREVVNVVNQFWTKKCQGTSEGTALTIALHEFDEGTSALETLYPNNQNPEQAFRADLKKADRLAMEELDKL